MLTDIEAQHGPIDIYLHDLGIGTTDVPKDTDVVDVRRKLEENLSCAQDLSDYFKEKMGARTSGRIVFIAPWGWDKYAAPIRFETVRAGTMALSRAMSSELAGFNVNVNCIVPRIYPRRPSTKNRKGIQIRIGPGNSFRASRRDIRCNRCHALSNWRCIQIPYRTDPQRLGRVGIKKGEYLYVENKRTIP